MIRNTGLRRANTSDLDLDWEGTVQCRTAGPVFQPSFSVFPHTTTDVQNPILEVMRHVA